MNTHRNLRDRFLGQYLPVCLLCCVLTTTLTEAQPLARSAWTTSQLKGSPDPPAPFRIVVAFPKLRFEKPSSIEEMPAADRLLVTEIGGKVFSFPKSTTVDRPDLVLDLNGQLPPDLAARGVSLFDAEFHPNFAVNREWFVCYVHPGNDGETRVSRFQMDESSPPKAVPGSERVVITWPSGGHNGGCIEFGTDGFLYISTGDGSGPNPPDGLTTGQDVSDLLGAMLRIDVDRSTQARGYAVPIDNPFLETDSARPEIWAYGLRNPWKFGVDSETGDIFAADNGWETWEVVHRIVRGGNCGWPIREGRAALRTEVEPGPTAILPPVKDHHHSEANSVIGGPVYRGDKLPTLRGAFVYGDYITGTIWMVKPDRDGAYSNATLVDTDQRIIAFTEGSAGELFVLDYDFTGQVYELLPSNRRDTSAEFPRRLSETGLFESIDELVPATGVVPYRVQAERWVDGADAARWVAIPGNERIRLATEQSLQYSGGGQYSGGAQYPDGTVFVKHLSLPQADAEPIRLETQVLHFEGGEWRPYSYLWDEEGDDAHLVDSRGANRPLTPAGGADRTWHTSAVNECRLCHNAGSGFVLGFVPHQLNRLGSTSTTDRQLSQLHDLGVISNSPQDELDDAGRLIDPYDSAQSLEDRARSYLHANCSMCHHPGGNAIVSFYLRRDLPFASLNTNKGTGIGTFGMQDAKIIVPGDPYRSVLFYRMSKLGYARMPYIGSQAVDSRGVALIDDWIRSLPRDASAPVSPPAEVASRDATAIQALGAAGSDPVPPAVSVKELVGTTETSLALVAAMHRGSIGGEAFATVLEAGISTNSADIRGLFEPFLPESQRRATLGATFDPQAVLSLTGDRSRGQLIFFSDGARCRNCHEIDDRAQSVGPTLTDITKKYQRPQELLEHIVTPSTKVDDPFAAYNVVTTAGVILAGLIQSQTDDRVELKTAERKVVAIPHGEIEVMTRSTKSLMPERLLSDLTAQEAADLLAFLRSPK